MYNLKTHINEYEFETFSKTYNITFFQSTTYLKMNSLSYPVALYKDNDIIATAIISIVDGKTICVYDGLVCDYSNHEAVNIFKDLIIAHANESSFKNIDIQENPLYTNLSSNTITLVDDDFNFIEDKYLKEICNDETIIDKYYYANRGIFFDFKKSNENIKDHFTYCKHDYNLMYNDNTTLVTCTISLPIYLMYLEKENNAPYVDETIKLLQSGIESLYLGSAIIFLEKNTRSAYIVEQNILPNDIGINIINGLIYNCATYCLKRQYWYLHLFE